jgi:predicted ATP-grasp superfamily ATP-dependent carboligase
MRILVYEHITGGGMIDVPLPPSLAHEGDLMLRALLCDLCELQGIRVSTTRDARLGGLGLGAEAHLVQDRRGLGRAWEGLLAQVDAVWPIAPETVLEGLCRQVLEAGRALMNTPPAGVALAASKLGTVARLARCGVPVVPTYPASSGASVGLPDRDGPWVLKPDTGLGCEGLCVCPDRPALCSHLARIPEGSPYVVQPYVPGIPASLCLLCWSGEARLLSCNRQRILPVGDRLQLRGCLVNDLAGAWERCEHLAWQVAAALPELWGLVGVDLLMTTGGPRVLEVNPRLTTSYAGLRRALDANPAGLVLDLLASDRDPPRRHLARNRVHVDLEVVHVA